MLQSIVQRDDVVVQNSTNGDIAVFSLDMVYRYVLTRHVDSEGEGTLMGMLCNPSTATAFANDPTVTRMMNFARGWGYRDFVMGNIAAFRATEPKDMLAAADPLGPLNTEIAQCILRESKGVLVGWGTNGAQVRTDLRLMDAIGSHPNVFHLGLNRNGSPKHPLYLKGDSERIRWVRSCS